MSEKQPITIFWFRRDLRLQDNHGLFQALSAGLPVWPIFIFDKNILDDLADSYDLRVQFIYQTLLDINKTLKNYNKGINIYYGDPSQIFQHLITVCNVKSVFANEDYEPYGMNRDKGIARDLALQKIPLNLYKDHVFFEPGSILKADGLPYTIYTPFMKQWRNKLQSTPVPRYTSETMLHLLSDRSDLPIITLSDIGFAASSFTHPTAKISKSIIKSYDQTRNIPGDTASTTRLGLHLRFGTVSIRVLLLEAVQSNQIYLNELIWREFFIHILWHFPHVVTQSFKPKYDRIKWLNNPDDFDAWCQGKTGYPLVDAGMHELNQTGHMHNRVRMVTASFLCKHLLIDWRKGEAYFATKLLDYELASNNGNWQWAAGTGCDAAPYFRIFNPIIQLKKFDPKLKYVQTWAPEYSGFDLIAPIVDHAAARLRALEYYQAGLK